ncbi:hypothetical protein ACFL2H_11700 [Planctomycetota bacterium]
MTIKLRPPREQLTRLDSIAELGPDKLGDLSAHLSSLDDLQLHPVKLIQAAKSVLDEDVAELVIGQVVSLYGLIRKSSLTARQIVEGISEALAAHEEFDESKWNKLAPQFEELLGSKQVRLAATAIELTYDYANLVRSIRILTDIRPLYDEEAGNIEAAVVSHTLRLHFDSSDGTHELSLALDLNDIVDLKTLCERAIKKSEKAKATLVKDMKIPTVISGEALE